MGPKVDGQNTFQTYHTSSISCHGWLFHHLPCLGQRTGVNSNHPSRRRSFAHQSSTKQSLDIACGRCPSALPRKQRNGQWRPVLSLPLAGWLLLWGELMFEPTGWKPSERFRHFYICSLGWGGVITFTYLRTPMMLRHGTFTCTCAHTSCYVKDVSRHAGVGWGGVGNNVHVLAHSHDTPRTIAHIRHATLKMCDVTQGWGGVGWGNNVHVLAHSYDITPRHVHLHVRTYVMLRWRCVTSRRGGVGWGGQ